MQKDEIADILKEIELLRSREDAIASLQSARTGPTAIMLELSRLLSPGKSPTVQADKLAQIRRDNPLAAYNPSWDTRRVWVTEFNEKDRLLKLTGVARDGSDVSEFMKRMNLSDYFKNVKLRPGKNAKVDNLEVVEFAVEAEVVY